MGSGQSPSRKKDFQFLNAKETIFSAALNQNVADFCKVLDGGELGSGGETPTNFSFWGYNSEKLQCWRKSNHIDMFLKYSSVE